MGSFAGGSDLLLAHGVGARQDLPLPFVYVLLGAVLALAVSFGALAVRWRTSKLTGAAAGRTLAGSLGEFADSAELRWTLRVLGLAITGFVAWCALAGPDLATNPTAGFVYVIFWVGLVPASLLFGPVWRLLNPLRTIHLGICAALRLDPDDPPFELPRWVGYWPAAIGLGSFVWLELCATDRSSTETLTTYFSMYAGANLLGAMLFGREWFTRGDGFEVFSALIGRLSPLGRRSDGSVVLRNPLNNLDATPEAPGLIAVVGVMLGSTAFDSLTSTSWWYDRTFDSSMSPQTLSSIALAASIGGVTAAFCLASWLAGVLSGRGPAGAATAFAHSVIPIAVGYLIAHYFSLLVFAGQQTLIYASDPMADGSNIFGTADLSVNYGLVTVGQIASVQMVSIVVGHVLGVFAAHDRAIRLFPNRGAVISQMPMMVLMIAYTIGGLTLLFSE
ncbi:hypothetical protein [Sporichthya polymorpha]|uniref:hypothetical protein n=1 Tax=Sporichthya polymorpha TaxID=35751 RepID=UPI00048B2909|nr:hypothetical protein [Sporichthya polymorpha]